MKRLVICALCLCAGATLQALPVGNPGEASLYKKGLYCESNDGFCDPNFSWTKAWSLRLGFYGDYVFNRYLLVDDNIKEINNEHIQRTEIYTNAAYLALNFCNRIDLFTTLGGTSIHHIFDNRITFGFGGSELDYHTGFSWSAGARATLWECKCMLLGIEGQYFSTNAKVNYFNEGNMKFVPEEDVINQYASWQVGLGLSYVVATSCPKVSMIPYIAATWSGAKFEGDKTVIFKNIDDSSGLLFIPKMDNNHLWGFAVGTTFNLSDEVGVTVEGRYGSEVGIYVNGQMRF